MQVYSNVGFISFSVLQNLQLRRAKIRKLYISYIILNISLLFILEYGIFYNKLYTDLTEASINYGHCFRINDYYRLFFISFWLLPMIILMDCDKMQTVSDFAKWNNSINLAAEHLGLKQKNGTEIWFQGKLNLRRYVINS